MVGNVALGSEHPIKIQTMTTTNTKMLLEQLNRFFYICSILAVFSFPNPFIMTSVGFLFQTLLQDSIISLEQCLMYAPLLTFSRVLVSR